MKGRNLCILNHKKKPQESYLSAARIDTSNETPLAGRSQEAFGGSTGLRNLLAIGNESHDE